MNLEELKYDLCVGCAERSPNGMGILTYVNHCCPLNIVNYRMVSFKLRHFNELLTGRRALQSFYDLLTFPYFSRMPDFESSTTLEKILYFFHRQSQVKDMKRLRAYIELEEDLNAKW